MEHISNLSTTAHHLHHQRVHSAPRFSEREAFDLINETKRGHRHGRSDGGAVPTQSLPLQFKQSTPDIVIAGHPQTDIETTKITSLDNPPSASTGGESTQRKEQTRTMSDPEPNFNLTTVHPFRVGFTPPRSISSPAGFDQWKPYEDPFTTLPPSPIQSNIHAHPPNYILKNPDAMSSNHKAKAQNLKPTNLVTSNLIEPHSISQAPRSLFNAHWAQIQNRRTHNMGLRSEIRDMRRRLREKQNAKAAAEDRFFQRVRKKEMQVQEGSAKKEDELMLHLMQRYQQERDEYGPLEDDCNRLEDQLYADELTLYQLENDFYQKWTVVPDTATSPRPSNSPQFDDPPTPSTENAGEEEPNFSYHPMVEKLLSKQGDLDLLFERIDEIYDERENLDEQAETRAALGLPLGAEEQAWLEKSEGLLTEVEVKIAAMEAEVDKLKEECQAQGLVDEEGEPIDMFSKEMNAFRNEKGLDTKSEMSEYTKYPKLLQMPLVKEDEGLDFLPDLGEESFSLGARINKWMLDRLRSSALEVNLLARTYEIEGKGKESDDTWQISVLKFWYEDGTVGFEAHTSTVKSGASGRFNTPVRPSEFEKTIRDSPVEIRIASSLPAKVETPVIEGMKQEVGRLVRPLGVISGLSSHSH